MKIKKNFPPKIILSGGIHKRLHKWMNGGAQNVENGVLRI